MTDTAGQVVAGDPASDPAEVALLDPVFARAGERFSLVGHSYGGGIALMGAIVHRQRLRALALLPFLLVWLIVLVLRSPD